MADAALLALSDFETGRWGKKYNAITPLWWRPREQVTPFFAQPPEIRRPIYSGRAAPSGGQQNRAAQVNQSLRDWRSQGSQRGSSRNWNLDRIDWQEDLSGSQRPIWIFALGQIFLILYVIHTQNQRITSQHAEFWY